jgi:hypothetical protein
MEELNAREREVLDDAKKRHRPSLRLSKWHAAGFARLPMPDHVAQPESSSMPVLHVLSLRFFPRFYNLPCLICGLHCFAQRFHCSNLTVKEFVDQFEKPGLPVVIEGIPHADNWEACSKWNLTDIASLYRNRLMKCGEDDNGKSVKVKVKYFVRYLQVQQDDSPLYIFDSNYDEDRIAKGLLKDYSPPAYFRDDLFRLVGEDRRPP